MANVERLNDERLLSYLGGRKEEIYRGDMRKMAAELLDRRRDESQKRAEAHRAVIALGESLERLRAVVLPVKREA